MQEHHDVPGFLICKSLSGLSVQGGDRQWEESSLDRALLGSASRSRGRPYSAACPLSITSMVSPSMTVCRRWAMAMSVQSLNSDRMVFWMSASVSTSTWAVASSRTRICSQHTDSWMRDADGIERQTRQSHSKDRNVHGHRMRHTCDTQASIAMPVNAAGQPKLMFGLRQDFNDIQRFHRLRLLVQQCRQA